MSGEARPTLANTKVSTGILSFQSRQLRAINVIRFLKTNRSYIPLFGPVDAVGTENLLLAKKLPKHSNSQNKVYTITHKEPLERIYASSAQTD